MSLIYKILDQASWQKAKTEGIFKGAGIDLQDGYIHFSTADQMRETARLHFTGLENLILFAIDTNKPEQDLKWEASRGGQLFPHVYGHIDMSDILWAKPLPWDGSQHLFPEEAK